MGLRIIFKVGVVNFGHLPSLTAISPDIYEAREELDWLRWVLGVM